MTPDKKNENKVRLQFQPINSGGHQTATCAMMLALGLLIAAAPLRADEPTVLESLQRQLDAQQKEIDELRRRANLAQVAYTTEPTAISDDDGIPIRDLLSGIQKQVDGAVQSGTSATTMKVVGRVHVDYWGFPSSDPGINFIETGDASHTPQDRVGFRRMRFGVRGDVSPNMTYRIEMEFAGGNDAEFRDAWLGFKGLGLLQTLLIGNQKRPYGLDHLNSSRYNVFIERPFVIESFNQDARRLGIASYGVSDEQDWNWRFGVYNQRLIQDEGQHINDHLQAEIAGRVANTFLWEDDGVNHGHWALSGTVAHPDGSAVDAGNITLENEARFRHRPEARSVRRWIDTGRIAGADWYTMIGFESLLNFGPLQLCGEYQNLWLERDAGFGDTVFLTGGYAYVSYFLTGENMVWSRKSGTVGRVKPQQNFYLASDGEAGGWGAWQLALRWSYADFTDEDITGGVGEALTFGLNWHWNPNARLQFNYINGRIADRNIGGFTGGDYEIIGTRFMIDF